MKAWRAFTAQEVSDMLALARFRSHSQIARTMGRSVASVRNKLRRLGVVRTEAERRANHARAYRR